MKLAPTYQKLRGGYYTPKPIANFLARWAIQSPDSSVLEPSCGDGVLLESAIEALLQQGAEKTAIPHLIHGVEIDPDEAAKARARMKVYGIYPSSETIHIGDFFTYCQAHLLEQNFFNLITAERRAFDAIIGNPPFIRYQNFPEEYRGIAVSIMKQAGLKPSRLMNSWLPFLVASTLLLKKQGRLAMVIPAELFQVNYAAETRRFLSDFYHQITIITFKKLVFDDIQQEVVLLLCERNAQGQSGTRVLEFGDTRELISHTHTEFTAEELKPMNHSKEKWTQYFLSSDEILLLRSLRNDPRLTVSGQVIDADVGIVTGENKFFILNEQQVQAMELEPFTQKVVGRSNHLKGMVFNALDWQSNAEKQAPAFLLNAPDVPFSFLPEPLKNYVRQGEEQQFHQGYKCRNRTPWYVVPSIWTPEAFMLRQVHGYPKIILNEADATCTDTIHRVRFRGHIDKRAITAAFFNVLTFAFAEVTGRSYGGGVLTFEPSEAEYLPIPLLGAENLDLCQLDKLLRENNMSAALAITDDVLLKNGLGLSAREIKMLHNIWEKLRERRIGRR